MDIGGKIEPGETAVQATLREMDEETGLELVWEMDGSIEQIAVTVSKVALRFLRARVVFRHC